MTYEEKISKIVAEIAPVLKSYINPVRYAEGLVAEADSDEETYFEVRAFHTKNGVPHAFTI